MWILEILGSAGFGSLIGGVFGFLSKIEERKNLAIKMAHELSMLTAKTKAQVELVNAGIEEAKVVGTLAIEKSEADAFKLSQVSSGFGGTIKACVRPVILGVLLYQTWLIFTSLDKLTGGLEALTSSDVIGLYKIVVLSITGLTATAVGWYFASRTSKQFDVLVNRVMK
jgi:hypothetical protein